MGERLLVLLSFFASGAKKNARISIRAHPRRGTGRLPGAPAPSSPVTFIDLRRREFRGRGEGGAGLETPSRPTRSGAALVLVIHRCLSVNCEKFREGERIEII